jgi:capsule polysaccharide export protein KpsC/LpsZ
MIIKNGFLRNIQVLQNRTRPVSAMIGASGYLFTGVKVSSLAE